MKTLVLGCDILEAEKLCQRLGEVGIVAEAAVDHRDGCARLMSTAYDVALLDLAPSVPAGIETLRTLRRAGCATPVICLMARSPSAATRVACLDAGADAFLPRPLEYDVLRAKMDAVHRRNIAPNGLQTLRFADLVVEPQTQSVQRNKRKIVLTTLEFRLLTYFMRHPNRIATLDMLAEQVWRQQHVSLNTLRVRIHGLRRKINAEGEKPLIRAVKDMGYVLE